MFWRRGLGIGSALIEAVRQSAGAMALHKEKVRMCRELGDKAGLARSLMNQALLLVLKMNQSQKALPMADEAYRLAARCGYASLAEQIEGIRAKIRSHI